MTLSITSDFIDDFLSPISKINNSCVLKVQSTGVSSLLTAADNTMVLYGRYTKSLDIDNTDINIPDLTRLVKILQCIDEDEYELVVEKNNIGYSSDEIRFKYHLLEDGILSAPPINIDKIKELQFDTTFTMPFTSLVNLIKSASFTIDINKVYLSTRNNNVYAEICDKQAHNVDSIRIKLCDSFEGSGIDDDLPVSLETIRVLAGMRCRSVNVNVNSTLNVMTFDINNDNIAMTYIISGLAK